MIYCSTLVIDLQHSSLSIGLQIKNATSTSLDYLIELCFREICLIESVEGNMYVQKRIECFKCAHNFWISKSQSCAFSAWVAMLPGQAGSWGRERLDCTFFQVENRPCQRAYGSWRRRGWCGGGPPGSWRRGWGSGSRGTRPRRAWWGSWTKRTRSTTNGRSAWIEDRCRMGRRVLRVVWGKRTVFRPNCHLAISPRESNYLRVICFCFVPWTVFQCIWTFIEIVRIKNCGN